MSLLTRIDDFDLLEDPFEDIDLPALISGLTLVSDARRTKHPFLAPEIKFTPYTISTMTMLSGIDARVDIDMIFNHVSCSPHSLINARLSSINFKGTYKPKKRRIPKKIFFNQITFDVSITSFRKVSVKLFRDGNVQLAGCKTETEARVALSKLTSELDGIKHIEQPGHVGLLLTDTEHLHIYEAMGCSTPGRFREVLQEFKGRKQRRDDLWQSFEIPYVRKTVESEKKLEARPPITVMINSDFDAGLAIDKEAFVDYLRKVHGLFCRPFCSSYPGANIKYTSNANCAFGCQTHEEKVTCNALRKRKKRVQACVTVSILAFSTGKIILTGARSTEQLDELYLFLKGVFERGYEQFRLKS